MPLLLVALLGCVPDPVDTGEPPEPTACDCEDPAALPFSVSEAGGFDDWSGAAVAWAVDESAGRALVVAMEYETGVGQIRMAPTCEDPDALVGSWIAAVPDSAADIAARFPMLASALTTAAGVRSLTEDLGALLLEGDLDASSADRVHVATDGDVTLLRREGGDTLQGALVFGARADAVGGDAEAACDETVRVGALDLDWSSGGVE